VVVVVVAAVVCGEAVEEEPAEVDFVDEAPEQYVEEGKSQATGRTFGEMSRTFWSWMGYDYDDYEDDYYGDEYYDYQQLYYSPQSGSAQIGYGLPAVGYAGSGTGSSYSSYSPIVAAPPHHFNPARHDNFEDEEYSYYDILYNMALAVVPMGLMMSALPVGVFSLGAFRRRSLDDNSILESQLDPSHLPLLHALMESEDVLALVSPQCQEKLFCEITRIGELEGASYLQRAFYYVATLTPDFMARRVGLARLFRASRAGACDVFHCSAASGPTPPPRIHSPPDTNHIDDVSTSPEQETVEAKQQ